MTKIDIIFNFLKNREVWRVIQEPASIEEKANKVLMSGLMTYDRALALANAFHRKVMIDWKEVRSA